MRKHFLTIFVFVAAGLFFNLADSVEAVQFSLHGENSKMENSEYWRAAVSSTSGKSTSLSFPNPLVAKDFTELLQAVQTWLFYLALPIAVIMIVVSGIIMMASGGDPGRFGQAKKMLLWAVIGLAVILIGEGFLYLIESIINLKNR